MMLQMRVLSCCVLSMFFVSATPAAAALLAYEGFDYPQGTALNGASGGSGWAGNWAGTGDATATAVAAMEYQDTFGQDLVTSGRGAFLSRGSRDVARLLPNRYTEGVYWLSFMMQPTFELGDNNQIVVRLEDSTAQVSSVGQSYRLLLGKFVNDNDHYGVRFSLGTVVRQTDFSEVSGANHEPRFFVVRYGIGTGSNDGTVHLFIDPPSLTSEPALASAAAALTGLNSAEMAVDRIRLQTPPVGSPVSGARGYFDEIRFGTSYAAVTPIPEPATAGLVLLAALAGLVRRRR
jgi:hypothetical protein